MSVKFDSILGDVRESDSITETDPIFSASEAANFESGDKDKLDGIEAGAEVNNISDANATDLTDTGATTLHKHSYNNLDDKPSIPTQYTDEMAQDAVGNAVGTGLDYDDATGAISVDKTELSLSAGDVGLGSVNNSSTTNGMWESSGGNTQLKTADDIDFAKYKAIQMACDNGTTFPASPNTGQWFYHTTIKTLFIYEAAWKSIISFGAVTLYVDGTNGTDAVGKGYATGAGATKTVQYAIDLIPPINGGNVVINIAAGTYGETATIQGKYYSGNYSISLIGEDAASSTTGTASGGGTDADTAYLDDSTKGWTVNAYTGYFLKITGGTGSGQTRVIESNTATKIRIIGNWDTTPNATSTYKVCQPASIIYKLSIASSQTGIIATNLKLANPSSSSFSSGAYSYITFYDCWFSLASDYYFSNTSVIVMFSCFMDSAGGRLYIMETPGARLTAYRCWFKSSSTTAHALSIGFCGFAYLIFGTKVSNGYNGICVHNNATASFMWDAGVGLRCRITDNTNYGVYVEAGGQARMCANNYYNNNTAGDYTGVATSYGYAAA